MIQGRFSNRFRLVVSLLLGLAFCIQPVAAWADDLGKAGHVLNRIGYGPSPADLAYVQGIGIEAYVTEQLKPEAIDESDNIRLLEKQEALFEWLIPTEETRIRMALPCLLGFVGADFHTGLERVIFISVLR